MDDDSTGETYTLAVALANPAHVEQLMRTAVDVARGTGGDLVVASVVHKPVTSPFLLFSDERIEADFDDDTRAVLDRAAAIAEAASVPVRTDLRVGSDVADALLDAVAAAGADGLLLGWRDRTRPSDVVLGTTVDAVVRRAPCDVFVERVGTTADGLDAVLLPTDDGQNAEAAADFARAVAAATGASVTVASYVERAGGEGNREAGTATVGGAAEGSIAGPAADAGHAAGRERVAAAASRLDDVAVEREVRAVDDVADAIVADASDHDLVVLGATRERHVGGTVVGSVAAAVGRRVDSPVVIAKRGRGGSLLGRMLGHLWR